MDDMARPEHVLEALLQPVAVATYSKSALIGNVESAARSKDESKLREHKRDVEEAQREGRTPKEQPPGLRRKEGLRSLPESELGASVRLTYLDLLHHLARGLSLTQRGAARGLAEHWGSLKYIQALHAGKGSLLWLSSEGRRIAKHYKTLQSDELGQAFALAVTERVLRKRFPGHRVSILHSDTVLRAGWALKSSERDSKDDKSFSVSYRYRPYFLAEVWKPSHPSMIFPVAYTGNHSGAGLSYDQLASCSAYVDGVHVGALRQTPGLLFSTALPLDGPVTVYTLHAPGDGPQPIPLDECDADDAALNRLPRQENHFPGIDHSSGDDKDHAPLPGCQIKPEHFGWFRETLAHTDAAGVTAFAGAGRATAQLLTERQGRRFFETFEHPAAGSVQDITRTLLGDDFAGTDYIFRLNGQHVEAFSGVQKDLFQHLTGHLTANEQGEHGGTARVAQWRTETSRRATSWPRTGWDHEWGGPVSIHQDGTVLGIRPVNVTRTDR